MHFCNIHARARAHARVNSVIMAVIIGFIKLTAISTVLLFPRADMCVHMYVFSSFFPEKSRLGDRRVYMLKMEKEKEINKCLLCSDI